MYVHMTELVSGTDGVLAEKLLYGLSVTYGSTVQALLCIKAVSGSTGKLVSRAINGWQDAQLSVSTAVDIALDEMYSNLIMNPLVRCCWCT